MIRMIFHDPHMNPEPILVVSGLLYLIPAYYALIQRKQYSTFTYSFLTCTTVGFHGTRSELLFALDCLAILNFLAHNFYMTLAASRTAALLFTLSVVYSTSSYFIGQRYAILSFDPDWNTQMLFHSLMHVSTAYSSYVLMTAAKSSEHQLLLPYHLEHYHPQPLLEKEEKGRRE